MDVAKLVQEQRFVERLGFVQENRPAKSDSGDVRREERPPADSRRNSPDAEARVAKLGIPLGQFPR
jgi:hypothetical protein